MFWSKFGTPTGRATSGTEEEYLRAKKRWDQNAESVRIMFYFKDMELPPSAIKPDELTKIQAFKKRLESDGVLYWTFRQLRDFERAVTLHLCRQIQTRRVQEGATGDNLNNRSNARATAVAEIRTFLTKAENLKKITLRLAKAQQEYGERCGLRERQKAALLARDFSEEEFKRFLDLAASDIAQLATSFDSELTNLRSSIDAGFDALIRALTLLVGQSRPPVPPEAAANLKALLVNADERLRALKKVIESLSSTPYSLMRAKRNASRSLERTSTEFRVCIGLLEDVEALLQLFTSFPPRSN